MSIIDRYDALSPRDGFLVHRAAFYAALYPVLRQAAREHDYALTIHGSLIKDLDVVAVPWTAKATDADTVVRALVEVSGGAIVEDLRSGVTKPHGRLAFTIQLGVGGYIDLSVMPRKEDAQ